MVALPATMALIDGAKMWGYARGLARRAVGDVSRPDPAQKPTAAPGTRAVPLTP